jgi:2'-5' RNA ligase
MRAIERVRRDATSDTWRLFIAVELSPAAIAEIAGFINDMPPGPAANVRWTPRDNVHLTLQFLGDTDPGIVGQVQRSIAAEAANTAPMLLALGETGAFPELRNPRILWVGLTGDIRRLVQLQGRLEGAMREFEYEPERKSFTPHITVGRAARDLDSQQAGDIGFSWRRSKMPRERAQIPVREVVLYRSRLQLGGPTYEKIFTAKLGG